MRLISLIVASLLLLIGVAGLALRFVPPGHIGQRGDARLAPGPQWTTPLHPVRIEADGPRVYGLRGALEAFPAADADGEPIQVGAILEGATLAQVKAALAAGAPSIPGATVFMRVRSKPADADAAEAARAVLKDEAAEAAHALSFVTLSQSIETNNTEDARARAAAEEAQARAQVEASNAAEVERVQREAQADIAAIEAQNGAEVAALVAEGNRALAQAEARRDALRARALAGPGGRYHLAIEAARRFSFDPHRLDAAHPEYFRATWGLAAWRRYFLGDALTP